MLCYYFIILLLSTNINIMFSYDKTYISKLLNHYNEINLTLSRLYNVTNIKIKDKESSYDSYSHII